MGGRREGSPRWIAQAGPKWAQTLSEAQPHSLSLSLDFASLIRSGTVTTGHSPITASPGAAWTGLGQQVVSLKQSQQSFPQRTGLLQGPQTMILEALRLQTSIIRLSGRSARDEVSLEEDRAPGRLWATGRGGGPTAECAACRVPFPFSHMVLFNQHIQNIYYSHVSQEMQSG